ncbi:hypothetical protein [Devosia chinhatensis]|uniref:Polyketide cyclase n=1 Tax=Devosia chinhatensis TaxID=429727 RepID=A0A0F5FH13_9HYPH|nr:hypothetical protein [Devosia chinhatensis]KKB07502.1 hypothetical protein VE26_12180 [Devosia chinhatensis]
MFPSRTISLVIERPCAEVYAFLADPRTLAQWTEGLLHEPLIALDTWTWTTAHDGQPVVIHFTPPNQHGVLDIRLDLVDLIERHYRVRVFTNGTATELCCTVLQSAGEDDAHFASECEWLRTDLKLLKTFLEARSV